VNVTRFRKRKQIASETNRETRARVKTLRFPAAVIAHVDVTAAAAVLFGFLPWTPFTRRPWSDDIGSVRQCAPRHIRQTRAVSRPLDIIRASAASACTAFSTVVGARTVRAKMPQLIVSNGERFDLNREPAGTDADFPDVLADLDLDTVPDEVVEYARVRLGETEESRTKLLAELEDMIYEKGDVTPHRMDEKFLLRFLRARHFKLHPSYKLFVNYHRFRENHEDYYSVNPLDLSFIADSDVLGVLPYREQTGRRILIYKLGNWNTNNFDMNDILKASLATLELGILEPRAQILGGVVIFDMGGFTLQHAYQITPKVVSTIIELIVSSIPMKTYAIHIINESWVFDTVFNLFKPLLGKRYNEMLFFHGKNMESLHKHIDVKYLPKVYGGVRPSYSYQYWLTNLQKNIGARKEMEGLGYNVDIK